MRPGQLACCAHGRARRIGARPERVRVVAHGCERAHASRVHARCRRVRAVVRTRRLPERGRPRPPGAAALLLVPADARLRQGVDLAQGRVGARVRALPAPPRRASTRDVAARLRTARGPKKLPRVPRRDDAIALLDDRVRRDGHDADDPADAARRRDARAALRRGPPGQRVLRSRCRTRSTCAGARSPCSARARRSAACRSAGPPATPSRPT